MTGNWKRILVAFTLIIIMIWVGNLAYQISPILEDGQFTYETIRGRYCQAIGLRTKCMHYSEFFDPDPDLSPLRQGYTFLDVYKHYGLIRFGEEENILVTELFFKSPSWSPDHMKIAYPGFGSAGKEICIADTDGKNEQCYQVKIASKVWNLSWSADGRQIAFSAHPKDETRNYEIRGVFVFDLDTLSTTLVLKNAHEPSWSPDGKHLVIASDRDGNSEIYTVGVDGSNLKRITDHPAEDSAPEWSPDGNRIAFVSDRGGGMVQVGTSVYYKKCVYIVDVQGGQVQVLISRPFDSVERFVWGE